MEKGERKKGKRKKEKNKTQRRTRFSSKRTYGRKALSHLLGGRKREGKSQQKAKKAQISSSCTEPDPTG